MNDDTETIKQLNARIMQDMAELRRLKAKHPSLRNWYLRNARLFAQRLSKRRR